MTAGVPGRRLLIAAFSARQIAASAALCGHRALAVDFFADLDLREVAERATALSGPYPDGFEGEALLAHLEAFAAEGEEPAGFLWGAGFEDRPDLLERIGARWPILGTGAATVRRLKDPAAFAALCERAGVPHPETLGAGEAAPRDRRRRLSKQVGGCGGSHVRKAQANEAVDGGRYLQAFVPGERVSAFFAADGREAVVLGLSRQWADPAPDEPFRYGGAVGPVRLPDATEAALAGTLAQILAALAVDEDDGVRGLASADFVLSEAGPVLLEINPRFGATLDVFESPERPLLAIHLDALEGRLDPADRDRLARPGRFVAAGLAWADEDVFVPAGHAWPEFARDRTAGPATIAAGAPLATVVAVAAGEAEARALFDMRVTALKTMLCGRQAA